MSTKKYRKLPVVIEAFRWTGDHTQIEAPEWIYPLIKIGKIRIHSMPGNGMHMVIDTLEGLMIARQGDFIIKGVMGEIYPCKEEIFLKTYEEVNEQQ